MSGGDYPKGIARVKQLPLVPALEGGEIWGRLKGETRAAFANFVAYRDSGWGNRSIRRTAAELGKNPVTLFEQSRLNHWQDRVDAMDDARDRRDRELRETERDRINRNGIQAASHMQTQAIRRMIGDPSRKIEAIDPNTMKPGEVAAWFDTSAKWLRIFSGQPTDVVAGRIRISAENLGDLMMRAYEIGLELMPDERKPRYIAEWRSLLQVEEL